MGERYDLYSSRGQSIMMRVDEFFAVRLEGVYLLAEMQIACVCKKKREIETIWLSRWI